MRKKKKVSHTEILNFLLNNQGYLKKGKEYLAAKMECCTEDIQKAKWAAFDILRGRKEENTSGPKILVLDIETAPLRAYIWRVWKTLVPPDQLISEWFILTWCAKWYGDEEVFSERLSSEEAINEDDKRIVKKLWNLVDEADIIIAHAGEKFDVPKIKTRFLYYKMPPPSFFQIIDTKKAASKELGLTSNKLDVIADYFGLGRKIRTDFTLWEGCMKGDETSLQQMLKYNKRDVLLLEDVYTYMLPYIKSHPNVTLYDDVNPDRCTSCGSEELERDGFYYTTVGKFQVYRCKSCGSLCRSRKATKRSINTANLSLGR